MFSISQPVYFFFVVSYSSRRDPSQPSLVTRELEKAFEARATRRRSDFPPIDPRGHTGVGQPAPRELELLVIVVAKMFIFCSFLIL